MISKIYQTVQSAYGENQKNITYCNVNCTDKGNEKTNKTANNILCDLVYRLYYRLAFQNVNVI